MQQLIEFISRSRYFILFALLEIISFRFIVANNNLWNVTYFNSANTIIGNTTATTAAVQEFIDLKEVNSQLAEENRQLRQMLTVLQQKDPTKAPLGYQIDSSFAARYKFVTIAQVIDNSTTRPDNFFTINRGTKDGVKEGMGVVTPQGIAGKVRFCNESFSIVTSVLHSRNMISAKLIRSGDIGTAAWDGVNASMIQLKDISRNTKVTKGDTVVTSDLNAVFPSGLVIGRVVRVGKSSDQASHLIDIKLGLDFGKLSYVYLVENQLIKKQEEIQAKLEETNK